MKATLRFTVALLLLAGCSSSDETGREASTQKEPVPASLDTLRFAGEEHLQNIRQLTRGGENAEGYFSPDGTELVFQATRGDLECDQIFRLSLEPGAEPRMVSNGRGRTTCAYFYPDNESIIYASTHLGDEACPPRPDFSQGYVWAVYEDFDLFLKTAEDTTLRLTDAFGYDAEATVSPKGDRVVFTSKRTGDLEIWSMNLDGTDLKRLTRSLGYDGGPFYSPDGTEIVFRAYYPDTREEREDYVSLLEQNLIRPSVLNLYVMDADGSNKRLVLENGAANFAPFFFPDGERIIFSSNMDDPQGRNFELYMIHKDGSGLERLTYNETFDGFPMFSPDGKRLVFASNRNNTEPQETNLFIAEWVD